MGEKKKRKKKEKEEEYICDMKDKSCPINYYQQV